VKASPLYGVSNPGYVSSDSALSSTEKAYGPADFVVETVKLDKAFFHKFFTSKPHLLGTDTVTSGHVNVNHSRKRGRESTDPDLVQAADAGNSLQLEGGGGGGGGGSDYRKNLLARMHKVSSN
jgi:hypothetical protein